MAALSSIAIGGAITAGVGAAVAGAGAIASAVGAASRPDPFFKLGAEGEMEKQGRQSAEQGLAGYRSAMQNEVAQGSGAQLDLANMLKRYSETGAVPSMEDITRSQTYAKSQFAPQETAMRQAFESQLTQANRAAAVSGRGVNDPILRAKLAQEQTRQQATLQAQQGAFASQFAQQQPFQRLGFASDRANTLVQRGQTALSGFQNMALVGSQVQNQGYNQRFQMEQAQYAVRAGTRSEGEKWGGVLSSVGQGVASIGSAVTSGASGLSGMNTQTSLQNMLNRSGGSGGGGANPFPVQYGGQQMGPQNPYQYQGAPYAPFNPTGNRGASGGW